MKLKLKLRAVGAIEELAGRYAIECCKKAVSSSSSSSGLYRRFVVVCSSRSLAVLRYRSV